jgi:hypothetical protein
MKWGASPLPGTAAAWHLAVTPQIGPAHLQVAGSMSVCLTVTSSFPNCPTSGLTTGIETGGNQTYQLSDPQKLTSKQHEEKRHAVVTRDFRQLFSRNMGVKKLQGFHSKCASQIIQIGNHLKGRFIPMKFVLI